MTFRTLHFYAKQIETIGSTLICNLSIHTVCCYSYYSSALIKSSYVYRTYRTSKCNDNSSIELQTAFAIRLKTKRVCPFSSLMIPRSKDAFALGTQTPYTCIPITSHMCTFSNIPITTLSKGRTESWCQE